MIFGTLSRDDVLEVVSCLALKIHVVVEPPLAVSETHLTEDVLSFEVCCGDQVEPPSINRCRRFNCGSVQRRAFTAVDVDEEDSRPLSRLLKNDVPTITYVASARCFRAMEVMNHVPEFKAALDGLGVKVDTAGVTCQLEAMISQVRHQTNYFVASLVRPSRTEAPRPH